MNIYIIYMYIHFTPCFLIRVGLQTFTQLRHVKTNDWKIKLSLSERYKISKSDAVAKEVFPNPSYSINVYLSYTSPIMRDQREQSLCLLLLHRSQPPTHFVYSRALAINNNKLRLSYHAVCRYMSQEHYIIEDLLFGVLFFLFFLN